MSVMIIDVRPDLLHRRLRECEKDRTFWLGWAAAKSRNVTHTLASLQQKIDEGQAQVNRGRPARCRGLRGPPRLYFEFGAWPFVCCLLAW